MGLCDDLDGSDNMGAVRVLAARRSPFRLRAHTPLCLEDVLVRNIHYIFRHHVDGHAVNDVSLLSTETPLLEQANYVPENRFWKPG